MIEAELSRLIREAAASAAADLGIADLPAEIDVVRPKQKDHGDYATNLALAIAAETGTSPREVAEILVRHLPDAEFVAKVEVAGPGFINFFLAHGWLYEVLGDVAQLGSGFGRVDIGGGERVQVEFVSANPTGPLHVGTGRNAVVGDSLARVLEAAGYVVSREYYVNDAGSQADLFAASLEARYQERFGREATIPQGGYEGSYVKTLAKEIADELGESLLDAAESDRRVTLGREGMERALAGIRDTLKRFRVSFDSWFHESELHAGGRIEQAVEALRERDVAYEADGAVWFAASRFGDGKDRVLIRSTGDPTYFAADCAYLRDKFARGFDRLIYVWGADHHGTVARLRGAAQAYGYEADRVEVILTQLIALYRGGEPVRMSKRTGEIVTLDELLDEVGVDAARYTLLTRSTDTALDFDIEAAARQTLDNPVYYVQYAYARIASILRYAEEQGATLAPFDSVHAEELVHETELDLLRTIAEFPEQITLAANLRAPYRLTRYVEEVAATFHRFYTECRVVTDDVSLTQARLHLAAATKQVIANGLALLGVQAPESMERLEEES
ncbi:MAG: arginine--tRNA ligase [Actinomycetota bacterium]